MRFAVAPSSAGSKRPTLPGRRPRIIAFAFDCKPGAGSESGAGWIWARLLAGIGDTTVLVPRWPHTEATLESSRHLPGHEADQLRFEVIERPRLLRRLVGDSPWPPLWYVEYAVWQVQALLRARALHRIRPFDISWHLTWANAWFGSLAGEVGPSFVYGPVGAGAGTPWRLLPSLGWRGAIGELVRTTVRNFGRYLNPVARRAIRRSSLIFVQNPETEAWLPEAQRDKAALFSHVVLEEPPETMRKPFAARRTALFAARLLAWKGGALALRTVARLPGYRLIVAGDGPDGRRLRALAKRLEIEDRVDFRGWVDRDELLRIMHEEASSFLFPSTHDEGGWVVAEAIANGLPVVCLDRGGPPVLGGVGVAASWPEATVRELAEALEAVDGIRPDTEVVRDLEGARAEVSSMLAERDLGTLAGPPG
jgi:glycosyltransferase involved in cell wall biosynthesis